MGAAIYLLVPMSLPFSVVSMGVGLVIVLMVGEPMVEGLKELGRHTGISDHIIGIMSSVAANLPEAAMTLFMIASPHLREVAILTVLLASAFNGLLLGILVVMVTYRGGVVEMPKKALEHDVELMRVTIAFCMIVFGTGVIMGISGSNSGQVLPWEVPLFQLVSYAGYLYFLGRGPEKRRGKGHAAEGGGSWATPIALGLVGTVVAAQLISGSAEFLVHMFDLHVVIAATVIGFAGSVPEHEHAMRYDDRCSGLYVLRNGSEYLPFCFCIHRRNRIIEDENRSLQ